MIQLNMATDAFFIPPVGDLRRGSPRYLVSKPPGNKIQTSAAVVSEWFASMVVLASLCTDVLRVIRRIYSLQDFSTD